MKENSASLIYLNEERDTETLAGGFRSAYYDALKPFILPMETVSDESQRMRLANNARDKLVDLINVHARSDERFRQVVEGETTYTQFYDNLDSDEITYASERKELSDSVGKVIGTNIFRQIEEQKMTEFGTGKIVKRYTCWILGSGVFMTAGYLALAAAFGMQDILPGIEIMTGSHLMLLEGFTAGYAVARGIGARHEELGNERLQSLCGKADGFIQNEIMPLSPRAEAQIPEKSYLALKKSLKNIHVRAGYEN